MMVPQTHRRSSSCGKTKTSQSLICDQAAGRSAGYFEDGYRPKCLERWPRWHLSFHRPISPILARKARSSNNLMTVYLRIRLRPRNCHGWRLAQATSKSKQAIMKLKLNGHAFQAASPDHSLMADKYYYPRRHRRLFTLPHELGAYLDTMVAQLTSLRRGGPLPIRLMRQTPPATRSNNT